MNIRNQACIFMYLMTASVCAQTVMPTPADERGNKSERTEAQNQSVLSAMPASNIGPTVFNGRVSDIDVNPADPTEFFVAYASGGLWYTQNNGTTFTPLFQQESVMTIGDIAVDWQHGTVWLGSGEQNSSRSSYAGNGMYKSTDKGKSWVHVGLEDTHHISKVVIHPENRDIVWVAALGHLYSTNAERGIYKTTDGGLSWTKTLFIGDETGCSDLVLHPSDNNVLYAAAWQRSRSAWNFKASGSGSGIYRSMDGGLNWKHVSGEESGFVQGEGAGRIGLAITVKEGREWLYAVIDNNHKRPKEKDKKTPKGLQKEALLSMSKEAFLKLNDSEIKEYLETYDFPEKYKVNDVIDLVKSDKIKVADIATYNDNANTALFDTPVIGAEVYVSNNQGDLWTKTHKTYLDDVYYSYGYYFGQIRVQPENPDIVYIFGVPVLRSEDGGKTWKSLNADNVHSDHHALWLNPKNPAHLINGNDGGLNITYDAGKSWIKCTYPEVGQFYYINVDQSEPYNVYGGTQDNGVWMGSHQYKNTSRWQSTGDYPYKSLLGGDGMQVQIDQRDNSTIYAGFQFGNYFRINKNKKERSYITPKHTLGQKPYRWNWQTPILLSPHHQDILYMGAHKLLRSMNQGRDFTEISGDLTKGGKEGNVPFGTITTIDESKMTFGLLYVGTDDGQIHVTRDGGYIWTKISDNLPQDLWVSRIQASKFREGVVYACLNGYRNDHFKPYVFASSDYGLTWVDIAANLPREPVNVIREDPFDEDILYVGTDHGTYVSFNKGGEYMMLSAEIPKVPVHDLIVQPKAKHLLIATHGRSIYKVNIKNLHELKQKRSEALVLFKPVETRFSDGWGKTKNNFTEVDTPKVIFEAFAAEKTTVIFEIRNAEGQVIKNENVVLNKGLAAYELPFYVSADKESAYLKSAEKSEWFKKNGPVLESDDGHYYPIPGKYEIRLIKDKQITGAEWIIKEN